MVGRSGSVAFGISPFRVFSGKVLLLLGIGICID
jgi:hypothetical protein